MRTLHAPEPAIRTTQQRIKAIRTNFKEEGWGSGIRLQRRTWMQGLLAAGLWKAEGVLAQGDNNRTLVIAQVVDMSPGQQDVSRDFLTGSRAAWQDINARGGIQGKPIQHLVLETDGTAAQVQSAWQTAYRMNQCVALAGCVGHQAASMLARHQISMDAPNPLPLIAPWLHQAVASSTTDTVFDVFADQRTQITHALKSLASMGVTQLGVAYSAGQDTAQAQQAVNQAAQEQSVKVQSVGTGSSLAQPIVLFIGGTPELHAFLGKLKLPAGRQCYVIALADINLQVLAQMGGLPPRISVIATQTVPLVTSSMAIVRSYRETLARLYDEPPSPQGLAGFIAARYTAEVLQQTSGALQRSAVLSSLQQRRSVNVGGWNVSYQDKKRLAAFVTQSMLSPDGRIVG